MSWSFLWPLSTNFRTSPVSFSVTAKTKYKNGKFQWRDQKLTSEIVGVGIGMILKFSVNVGGVGDECCIPGFFSSLYSTKQKGLRDCSAIYLEEIYQIVELQFE